MSNTRPLRLVTSSELRRGRGRILGADTSRRVAWWELTLECGHTIERPARASHVSSAPGGVIPPPKRSYCDQCTPKESR